jgi:hypothetical protein
MSEKPPILRLASAAFEEKTPSRPRSAYPSGVVNLLPLGILR